MKNSDEFWKIYKESFPENERRSLQDQIQLQDNPLYNLQYMYDGVELAGFIAFWDLDSFIFIEHFAIKNELRGKGYGTKILKQIIKTYNKNIVLEVEKTETPEAERRIAFYKRFGFCLNQYNYYQPPYTQTTQPVSLYLMSFPRTINHSEFIDVRKKLYTTVYNFSIVVDP